MADRAKTSTIPNAFVRSMPAWAPPPAGKAGTGEMRRMNLNESPYPPSPAVVEAMQDACTRVNRYPDAFWRDLTAALSARTGVPAGRVVLGNGSDELIASAGRIAIKPGDNAVAAVPSFGSFSKAAAINGGALTTVPVRADGACDAEAMLAAVDDRTRLMFLATPNNPTGGMLTADEVRHVATSLPDTCLLVVDEAYHEFAMQAGGEDPLAVMADRSGPWVVFRSFSKAYGLAGIRVGYALCGSDEVAGGFQLARNAFTVNAIAQAGALAALKDTAHMEKIVGAMAAERERVSSGLAALGCAPMPSVGNFVTAKTSRPAAEVVSELQDRGILIGRLAAPGFETHIRITVGTAEDTDALLAALKDIL